MVDFTPEQTAMLEAHLDGSRVSTRQGSSGRSLSYIEGWWAIREANRIFGFGQWSTVVKDLTAVVFTPQGTPNYANRDNREGYLIAYTATVQVTVGDQVHEDVGYGEGIDYTNVGQAVESAIKEAVTDARKRALMQWGNPFGLALYDKTQAEVDHGSAPARNGASAPATRAPAPHPERDDAMAALDALYGEDRAAVLAYVGDVLGREIKASSDIKYAEWTKVKAAAVDDLAAQNATGEQGAMAT